MFSTVDIDVYWYFHILFTIFHLWVLYCWRDIGTSIHRDFYWWVVLSASGCLFRSEHCEYKCNIWVKIGELYRGPRTAPWRDVLTRLVRSVSSGDVDLAGRPRIGPRAAPSSGSDVNLAGRSGVRSHSGHHHRPEWTHDTYREYTTTGYIIFWV